MEYKNFIKMGKDYSFWHKYVKILIEYVIFMWGCNPLKYDLWMMWGVGKYEKNNNEFSNMFFI